MTATFFKETDRCHHDSWLRAVSKSQYLRLRRNCSDAQEFLVQAEVLTERFLEKGYRKDTLHVVKDTDREELLRDKVPRDGDHFPWASPL